MYIKVIYLHQIKSLETNQIWVKIGWIGSSDLLYSLISIFLFLFNFLVTIVLFVLQFSLLISFGLVTYGKLWVWCIHIDFKIDKALNYVKSN